LVETAAVTGARVSQLARLEVQDVQGDRGDPRVMMPSSRKGASSRLGGVQSQYRQHSLYASEQLPENVTLTHRCC